MAGASERRTMGRFVCERGLPIVVLSAFLAFLAGQAFAARRECYEDRFRRKRHDAGIHGHVPVSVRVASELATREAIASRGLLSIWFRQRGSPEWNLVDASHGETGE